MNSNVFQEIIFCLYINKRHLINLFLYFSFFSGFRPLRGNVQEHEMKKFIIYSIYAWGCTFLISIITFFMDKLTFLPSGSIRPEFGKNSCFFGSKYF